MTEKEERFGGNGREKNKQIKNMNDSNTVRIKASVG